MITNSAVADWLVSVREGDLSTLVALRVLLRARPETDLAPEALLLGMQQEYQRLGGTGPLAEPADPDAGSDLSRFTSAASLQYLDEHVLGRLAAAGIAQRTTQPAVEPNGASVWTGVRLSPAFAEAAAAESAELQEWVEQAIARAVAATEVAPPANAAPATDAEAEVAHGAPPASEPDTDRVVLAPASAVSPPELVADAVPPPPAGRPDSSDVASAPEASIRLQTPPNAPGSTIQARGLVKVYRKRRVVNEVDLAVSQGEIVGLLGPNGAGKTTTFYMMVGLIAPDRGKVFLGRDEITSVPMYKRARRGIGYLSQEPSIFRKLTVEENVLAILQMMKLSRREKRERLEALLDELGIKHLRHSKAYALSGGERRRLEITRALVGEPKFMLLDEPFAGVDPIAVHDIQQIVADLRRRGIGVLISDHNVEQTLDIVDRAYIMYDGRVRVSGTVSELVWNEEVAEIYLGPTLTARMRQRYPSPA